MCTTRERQDLASQPASTTDQAGLSSSVPFLGLSREYLTVKPLILEAIEAVLSQQRFILGEQVAEFERQAAAKCSVPHAIGCASGTDALGLALAALGIGPGDAVVTTPFSFFATVSSILRAGARPVLADIDAESFNLDATAVRTCLSSVGASDIRAILPVHLFGQTADWDQLGAIQEDFAQRSGGPFLIEDAAQAFGARWNGRPAGSLGDAAAFSFYPTKNLSATGDAGMVTAVKESVADRIRLLHVHGMRSRYLHEEVGWNSRMDTLQAAVLLVKLRFIDEWNEMRRSLAGTYDKLFQEAGLVDRGPYPERGVVLPKSHPQTTHVFHQYVVRTRRRDELKAFLKEQGVASEVYYPIPLHLQPALKNLGYQVGDFPESERATREVLALPIFPQLTLAEQQLVVAKISDFLS